MEFIFLEIDDAIRTDNLFVIKQILEDNPNFDINYRPCYSFSLLTIAIKKYNYNIGLFFINYSNIDLNILEKDGETVLAHAIIENLDPEFILLLIKKTNINKLNTALYKAVYFYHPKYYNVVVSLLDHGADPHFKKSSGSASAFYYGTRHSCYKSLIDLLNNYGNLEIKEPETD